MVTKKTAPIADDVEDILGGATKGKAKPAAKKTAAAPVKTVAAKKAESAPVEEEAAEETTPTGKKARPPMRFAEGERDTIREGVRTHFKRSKKAINSKELAAKLGTEVRKLRRVLYQLSANEEITLTLTGSKAGGMDVSPA